MAAEVIYQLKDWDKNLALDGYIGASNTNFKINAYTVRKPYGWWMDTTRRQALDPLHNNQLAGI